MPIRAYKAIPAFRYVGCGYVLTPNSIYPPMKAFRIWRWSAKSHKNLCSCGDNVDDPYGARFFMGREAKDIEEVLGQTSMLIAADGQR